MHLLREDNWWAPGWVRAVYRRMGHGEAVASERAVARETDVARDSDGEIDDAAVLDDAAPVAAGGELAVSAAVPRDSHEAARGGRTTDQDSSLVPFDELMRRLGKEDRD